MQTNNQKALVESYEAAMKKQNAIDVNNQINETWGGMIQRTTGVDDPEKLQWMSEMANIAANRNRKLNEDAAQLGANAYSAMGGTYMPYNNLYNTLGVGDPRPAGRPALTGADYADPTTIGSGDKYPALMSMFLKVAAKTIGFELVNVTNLNGPTGVLPYMDYVYSGSKQPYGQVPAYDKATGNPYAFNQGKLPQSMYGLPHAFKASVLGKAAQGTEGQEGYVPAQSPADVKIALHDVLSAGYVLTATATGITTPLTVEFVGWSRIDGDPMLKIVNGGASLGDYFVAGKLAFAGPDGSDVAFELQLPRLVSMLEDQLQGFTGAGPLDSDPWTGTYQDGTVLYEPMSRGTGEMTMPRQISLQLFTKHVQVGTIEIGAAVTQEQVQDLKSQWGIDVVKTVENAAINELSATINRHITSRLFALGWKNHCKLVEVEGPAANMNISYKVFSDGKTAPATQWTKAYAIPEGVETVDEFSQTGHGYSSWTNVKLPFKPIMLPSAAAFENRDTLLKRVVNNILAASNWIQQRGRYGAATFIVTNITVATALQTNARFTFAPMENTIKQTAGNLYQFGTIVGLNLYVDPNMSAADCRVLVGRKGAKDEPGTHFCPYIMAEVTKIISEGTMAPKLGVKSRYALVDAGFFPETQYVTFVVDLAEL